MVFNMRYTGIGQMRYARINLRQTNYTMMLGSNENGFIVIEPGCANTANLQRIYKAYCNYKKFRSVMPIFDSEFRDPSNKVFGYYVNNRLVAFSLIRIYDIENVEAIQFAWDYVDPPLNLGIESLKNECAFFKEAGFKYYYLGGADEYKKQFDGFEMLGPA